MITKGRLFVRGSERELWKEESYRMNIIELKKNYIYVCIYRERKRGR
jgi:hypothetical protein